MEADDVEEEQAHEDASSLALLLLGNLDDDEDGATVGSEERLGAVAAGGMNGADAWCLNVCNEDEEGRLLLLPVRPEEVDGCH